MHVNLRMVVDQIVSQIAASRPCDTGYQSCFGFGYHLTYHLTECRHSYVAVHAIADHPVSCLQFLDAVVKRVCGLEPGRFDLSIGNEIITFVRILADRRIQINKLRKMRMNFLAQFEFRQIGVRQAYIVGFAFHHVKIVDCVKEGPGDITHMDVVATEIPLEHDNSAIIDCPVDEVVD